jgi:hypothetical protein
MSNESTKFDSICAACGRLIKAERPRRGIRQLDGTWHNIHPDCRDAYEQKLADKTVKRPGYVRPTAELVERECQRCGAFYAGQAGDVIDRCRYLLGAGKPCDGPLVDVDADDRDAEVTTVKCAECEWPMRVRGYLEPKEGAPAWLRAAYERYRPVCEDCADGVTAAAVPGVAASRPGAPAPTGGGSADRARTTGGGRLHKPGRQQALDGVEPSSSGSPSSRDAKA